MKVYDVLKTIEGTIRKIRENSGKNFGSKTDRALEAAENIVGEVREDDEKRVALVTAAGMAANLLFAIFNGVLGILRMVSWYGTLSAYYFLIFAAKLYLLKKWKEPSRRILTAAGWFLLAISIVLGGTVALIAAYKGEKQYVGLTLCVVAAYTFCKIALSVFNLHKANREQKAFQFALRKIGHADSLMSLLYLQTAVFFAVGDANSTFSRLFNAIVGGLVWCIVFANAIEMLIRRGRFRLAEESVRRSDGKQGVKEQASKNRKKQKKRRKKKRKKKRHKKYHKKQHRKRKKRRRK